MGELWKRFWGLNWWLKGAAILLVLIIVGAISGAVGGGDEDDDAGDSVASDTVVPSDTEIPEATETPELVWSDGIALSPATVTRALADGDEMIRSLNLGEPRDVQIDGDFVIVTYKAESALKETDLLTIGAQSAFSAHRALFGNPNVGSVTVIMTADWTDQFGASTEDVTTVSTLDRTTVQRIDWNGLEDRVILDNKHMFCISDAFRIHLGIYSRLGDTGCLTGAVRF